MSETNQHPVHKLTISEITEKIGIAGHELAAISEQVQFNELLKKFRENGNLLNCPMPNGKLLGDCTKEEAEAQIDLWESLWRSFEKRWDERYGDGADDGR